MVRGASPENFCAKGKRRFYFVHRLTARRALFWHLLFGNFHVRATLLTVKSVPAVGRFCGFSNCCAINNITIVTHSLTDYYLRDDKMAFWGLKVEPGKWTPFVPPPDEALRLHISQVSPKSYDQSRLAADRRRASHGRSEPTHSASLTKPSQPSPNAGHPRRRYPQRQGAHHRQVPRRG